MAFAVLLTGVTRARLSGDQAPTQGQPRSEAQPVFRSGVNLVLVDVVVRDRTGAFVKDLTADDFELFEDGVRQQILTFAVEEIAQKAAPLETTSTLSAAAIDSGRDAQARPAAPEAAAPATETPARPEPKPLTSEEVAGRRLLTLVFDTSSMQPEDVQKGFDSASEWVIEHMTTAYLVAVASIGSGLQVLTDFTSDKERLRTVLGAFAATDGTAYTADDASTAATDDAAQAATEAAADSSAQELDTFNNDVRLRALKALAEALQPIQQ